MKNSHLRSGNSTNCPDAAGDPSWILTSSFIIFTMQSGFDLLEADKFKTVILCTNVEQDLLCFSSIALHGKHGSHLVVIISRHRKNSSFEFVFLLDYFSGLFLVFFGLLKSIPRLKKPNLNYFIFWKTH